MRDRERERERARDNPRGQLKFGGSIEAWLKN